MAAEDSPQLPEADTSNSEIHQQEAVYLQVAAFSNLESARGLIDSLALLTDINVDILPAQAGDGIYRVLAGPIENSNQVDILQTLLELNGLPPGYRVTSSALPKANCVANSDTTNC